MEKNSSLNQDQLKAFEDRCTQDAPPACQAACPLRLDARRFAAHMKAGEWGKARALLEKNLPFAPLLTLLCEHPCEDACPIKDFGGAVAIHSLEQACIRLAPRPAPPKLLPAKGKKIAVLGSGIAALSAAWELALKGYAVEVFHSGKTPEEYLAGLLPENCERAAPDFPAMLSAYIAEAFAALGEMGVTFTPASGDCSSPGGLPPDCDGIFVDVGVFPALSPGESNLNPVTGSAGENHLLCFGGFAPSSIMRALEGRRGAVTLMRVMGKASPLALREQEGPCRSRLHADTAGVAFAERVLPSSGDVYTDGEARAEAARCLPCNCLLCVKECVYLRHYGEYPKTYARQMFLNMGIYTGYRRLNTPINSCSLCRQCEVLCPESFSMADLCLLMREEMVRQNKMPPSAHYFALQELAAATGPDSVLAVGAGPDTACANVFFPGCQLAACRSGQVRLMHRHLRQNLAPDTGIWLRCCGIPARYAARADLAGRQARELNGQWHALGQPRVIFACASCLEFFREMLPGIPAVSLWEVLVAEAPLPAGPGTLPPGTALSLHDPCPARNDSAWQNAVRALLDRQGTACKEPSATRETTACCGYGGLVWNANPEMSGAMAADRADRLVHDALTSCIMCREQFVGAGKAAWHLFDLLLPPEEALGPWLEANSPWKPVAGAFDRPSSLPASHPRTRGPGFSLRRDNRVRLKKQVESQEYGLLPEPGPVLPWALRIADDILENLERKRIVRQDIAAAILGAEKAGTVFYDRANDLYLAHHRPGPVTLWVSYRKTSDCRQILDAYIHRMDISAPKSRV